jgi:antitoxin component YwqK of YwqJK toxin-antitoxin module
MKKLVLLFSILFIIAACKHKNTNVEVKTYSNGSPKDSTYYEGEGAQKEKVKEVQFYPDKKEKVAGEFKNDKRTGPWVYYYPNGNKWSEGAFVDGLDDGKHTVYYENGNVRYEGSYNRGKQIGIWKFYDESGKLVKEKNYDKTDTTAAKKNPK